MIGPTMTAHTDQTPVDLPCHVCGYDLRAHPPDGKCPECGTSLAESRRLAAIPRRPAWRDSDPRWRRRILAGVWLLVLVPLMDALKLSGWASRVPVPSFFDSRIAPGTLDQTLLGDRLVYRPLIFCVGVVLVFAKERGRRPHPLDWTRRWGVICSYVVALLSTAFFLLIAALVFVGIVAVFHSMPPKYEPRVTPWFLNVSTAYLYYGLHPQGAAGVVLTASSSIAVLLACVPLSDALRSSGPKRLWAILLAPLALFSLMHLAQAGRYCISQPRWVPADYFLYLLYFSPELLVRGIADLPPGWRANGSTLGALFVEAAKWCIVLAIAVWLTIAQRAARRHATKTNAA
jgi:hypothetical protein